MARQKTANQNKATSLTDSGMLPKPARKKSGATTTAKDTSSTNSLLPKCTSGPLPSSPTQLTAIPKSIVVSSLALRFYEKDGWTEELLNKYISTSILGKGIPGDDYAPYYWVVTSGLDVDRLVSDGHVGKLDGRDSWGELKGLTDIEVLKRRA